MVSPIFAFGVVWIVQVLAYLVLPINLTLPADATWLVVLTGFLSLTLGALVFSLASQLVMENRQINYIGVVKSSEVNLRLLYFSIFISAITALFLFLTIERNPIGFFLSIKENILAESAAGYKFNTYLIYVFIYQVLLTLYYFNCNGFEKNSKTVFIFIAAILSALMSGSRGLVVFFIIALIPCIISKKHEVEINGKTFGKLLVIIIASFFIYPFLFQGMTIEGEGDYLKLSDYISTYLFSGITAFDDYLQTNMPSYDCILTIPRPLLSFVDTFWQSDLIALCPSIYEEKLLPLPTNVYSIFFAPYHDFGLVGVGIYLFAIGYISQLSFTKGCLRNNDMWRFFYCILFYSLMLSFFEDQFSRGVIYYFFGFIVVISNRLANIRLEILGIANEKN